MDIEQKCYQYKEHYVAFLDILGFKEHLKTNSCEDMYAVFDVLRKRAHKQLNLNGVQIEAYEHIKYTILSDSIVVYIDAEIEDAFATLVDVCSNLQRALANRDTPILMRGGIAKGDLFSDDGIIYGEGLVKAYLMETNLAKYPRIVFSGDTLEAGRKNTKYAFTQLEMFSTIYKYDDDCLYYVEYLDCYFANIDDNVRYFDGLKNLCSYYLNKEIDHPLREKYLWLQRKINSSIKVHSNLREYYDKHEEDEMDQRIKEYNDRFKIYPSRLVGKIKMVEENKNE